MITIHPKVTASTLGAGIGGYVVTLIDQYAHLAVPTALQALLVAAVTAGITFGVGYLKRSGTVDVEFAPATAPAPTTDALPSFDPAGSVVPPVK